MATERQSRNAATHRSRADSDPPTTIADYCQHVLNLSICSMFVQFVYSQLQEQRSQTKPNEHLRDHDENEECNSMVEYSFSAPPLSLIGGPVYSSPFLRSKERSDQACREHGTAHGHENRTEEERSKQTNLLSSIRISALILHDSRYALFFEAPSNSLIYPHAFQIVT